MSGPWACEGSATSRTSAVNPDSQDYGKVVHTVSVGGRNEAHHAGFTDDRHYLWTSGLDTSKVLVFDVHSDPAKPSIHKEITDFVARSGGVMGPHTLYALPVRMMISGLSNNDALVRDAFAAPVGEVRAGDPVWWERD